MTAPKDTCKLSKWGNGLGIRIPAKILRHMGLEEGVEFEIDVIGHVDKSIKLTPVNHETEFERLKKEKKTRQRNHASIVLAVPSPKLEYHTTFSDFSNIFTDNNSRYVFVGKAEDVYKAQELFSNQFVPISELPDSFEGSCEMPKKIWEPMLTGLKGDDEILFCDLNS